MQSYEAPEFIIAALVGRDLHEEQYYLFAAGQAMAFVRMAATALDDLGNEPRVAEYHAYAGVSAARTALDAAANWLRVALDMGIGPSPRIDFAKEGFRTRVRDARPEIAENVDTLGELARDIDPERQRAQHSEGLAMIFYNSGDWYISQGPRDDPSNHRHCPTLLRCWADNIEAHFRNIVQVVAR